MAGVRPLAHDGRQIIKNGDHVQLLATAAVLLLLTAHDGLTSSATTIRPTVDYFSSAINSNNSRSNTALRKNI